jgi:hypothetical protein
MPLSKQRFNLVINSTILFITAFLLTTILHETAHAIAGWMADSQPILHHNYVEHLATSHLSVMQQAEIALAGPLVGLLQGLTCLLLFSVLTRRRRPQLFILWLCVLGFNNFLGYLMTGPLFQAGDIGKIYRLLGTSTAIQIMLAIVAAGALLFMAYKMTRPYLSFANERSWLDTADERKRYSLHILLLPWLFGSIVVTLLYLPVIAIVSIIYPIMSGLVFIYPWQNAARAENIPVSRYRSTTKRSLDIILLLLLLILFFRLVLAPGVEL